MAISLGQFGSRGLLGGTIGFVLGAASSVLNPISNLISAGGNWALPTERPSAEKAIELFYKGGIDYAQLKDAIRFNGIDIAGLAGQEKLATMWSNIVAYNKPTLPFDLAYRMNILGTYPDAKLTGLMKRLGFPGNDEQLALLQDTNQLDLVFLLQLFDRGIISNDDLEKYLRHAGWLNSDFIDLLRNTSLGVDPVSALILLNRGLLDSNDIDKYQKWAGLRDDDVRKYMTQLRWQWPSITSITLWSQLGVFNEAISDKLKLDDEKPDGYYQFARANGQHWSAGDTSPETWPIPGQTPADLAWRGHWRPNDIATAITMLHRLRPSDDNPTKSNVAGIAPYTSEDFRNDLAANGIPPGRRDQFRAVTYSLPRFTVFRTALAAGTITKDGVVSRLQDSGYSQDTATLLADTWEHEGIQRQVDKLRPISLSQVKEAYRLGTISRQRAAIGLYMIYLDDYAQVQTFLGLPADAQLNLASDNGFVQLALTSIDADVAGELAKQAVEVVRKAYLRLEIDATTAVSQLANLGIVIGRATQYVQLWSYEHAAMGVEATAGVLRGWYIDHLIDQSTYAARLELLGYGQGDIALMVAAANLTISEKAAALQAKSVRAQQMQAKQLAAALKASQQQQRAIQKQMCSSGTRNQVADWTIKGYIDYYTGYKRLQECGMTGDDAVNLLTQKQPKKGGLTREQVEEKITSQPTTNGIAPVGTGAK